MDAVKVENNTQQQNAVYTLVQSIILHFVGPWDITNENEVENC